MSRNDVNRSIDRLVERCKLHRDTRSIRYVHASSQSQAGGRHAEASSSIETLNQSTSSPHAVHASIDRSTRRPHHASLRCLVKSIEGGRRAKASISIEALNQSAGPPTMHQGRVDRSIELSKRCKLHRDTSSIKYVHCRGDVMQAAGTGKHRDRSRYLVSQRAAGSWWRLDNAA